MRQSIYLFFAGVGLAATSNAGCNADLSGAVSHVMTYSHADSILFRLANRRTSHPSCNPCYFVVAQDVSADRRKAMLARLLAAYAAGETVNVGFDASGDCADGHIRVHRPG
jgi:hypothetical protein